jgi:L-iditol 2-dehydrogenase
VAALDRHDLVFEAVGRVEAWQQAIAATRPGGTVVFVGGCPAGTTVDVPTAAVHYDEVDLRGAFHHAPDEIEQAIALLSAGDVDWRALAGETVGLEQLADALRQPTQGEARKLVVDPHR